MIVFAAFTPHSPLLIPEIGKEHSESLGRTREAMERLAESLYAAHPDAVLILSSHGAQYDRAFSLNLHDRFQADFREFGSLGPGREFFPDIRLIDRIQRHVRAEGVALKLHADPELDYGSGVPLTLLTDRLNDLRVVQASYADGLSPEDHAAFGRAMKEPLVASPRRVAVLASGDLSHALSTDAPAGMRPEGPRFDERFRDALDPLAVSRLLALDADLCAAAAQCALLPAVILAGILEKLRPRTEILSYEHPYGVGYLTAQFHLS